MKVRLPPLNALRAFEAAARHLSFRKAAEELHVTPAAISHQIKTLEDYLGVQLFRRLNRSLQLTEAGQAGLPCVREGFECLAKGVERITANEGAGILTVSVTPMFAAKWLVPRIHRFARAHPQIDLRIAASMAVIDSRRSTALSVVEFHKDNVDVAIRFGSGDYPGMHVERLFWPVVVPVCSPLLLDGAHPLNDPVDLRYHTLLHHDARFLEDAWPSWETWLAAAQVKGANPRRGPRFNTPTLALEAAIGGQGVALSLLNLVNDEIEAGRLVVPFDIPTRLGIAFYVVCPESTAETPKVQAFRDWLLEEARVSENKIAESKFA
jgi:LysR family glycine cleavage system transcriptional activator